MSSDESPQTPQTDEEPIQTDAETHHERSKEAAVQKLLDADFEDWYSRYQYAANIRNGKPYFNGPGKLKPPGKFSASDLLKCHRKVYYKHQNAPEESGDPDGIFYFGTKFEEDLAEQFLEDAVTDQDTFVRNSVWVNTSVETEIGTVSLVGSTDPTITDESGDPILLSEVKTTSSVEYTTEPREHHLAQAHAYLYGLSEQQDRDVEDVAFLYAGRDSLEVKIFHETFDEEFWEDRVVDWMQRNKYYRVFGFLPPAEPEHDWECDYCPYQERCGQTAGPHGDEDAAGLLPLKTDYPREKVVEFLESHDEAKLTPSLAQEFPELAERYGAFDWRCEACDARFQWDEVSWSGRQPPTCRDCHSEGRPGQLRGPKPENQHHIEVVDREEDS